MSRIIKIELNKSKKKVILHFDDSTSLIVGYTTANRNSLHTGMDISSEQKKEMVHANELQGCLEKAIRLLAYRPRSELEIKQYLYKHGYRNNTIDETMEKLKSQDLVNDEDFASYWRDNRLSLNPKSRRMLKYELKSKGITGELVENTLSTVDDLTAAYNAGFKKARILPTDNYTEFIKRVSDHLKWRGFDFEVISTVAKQLWHDMQKVGII